MKKFIFRLILSGVLLLAVSISVQAQVYVKVRPTVTISERPVRPSQKHVWVGDEWAQSGDTYKNVGGHWEVPPRHGNRWKVGHWRKHGHDGEEWVKGGWRN